MQYDGNPWRALFFLSNFCGARAVVTIGSLSFTRSWLSAASCLAASLVSSSVLLTSSKSLMPDMRQFWSRNCVIYVMQFQNDKISYTHNYKPSHTIFTTISEILSVATPNCCGTTYCILLQPDMAMEEETRTHAIRRTCFVTLQFWCNNRVIYVMRFQCDHDLIHRRLVQTKPWHNFLQNVRNLACSGWWHDVTHCIARTHRSENNILVQLENVFCHDSWSKSRVGCCDSSWAISKLTRLATPTLFTAQII